MVVITKLFFVNDWRKSKRTNTNLEPLGRSG